MALMSDFWKERLLACAIHGSFSSPSFHTRHFAFTPETKNAAWFFSDDDASRISSLIDHAFAFPEPRIELHDGIKETELRLLADSNVRAFFLLKTSEQIPLSHPNTNINWRGHFFFSGQKSLDCGFEIAGTYAEEELPFIRFVLLEESQTSPEKFFRKLNHICGGFEPQFPKLETPVYSLRINRGDREVLKAFASLLRAKLHREKLHSLGTDSQGTIGNRSTLAPTSGMLQRPEVQTTSHNQEAAKGKPFPILNEYQMPKRQTVPDRQPSEKPAGERRMELCRNCKTRHEHIFSKGKKRCLLCSFESVAVSP